MSSFLNQLTDLPWKTTARNPKVGGNTNALAAPVMMGNGSGAQVSARYNMAVTHLDGANDDGTQDVTVEWDGPNARYEVTKGENTTRLAQGAVEK